MARDTPETAEREPVEITGLAAGVGRQRLDRSRLDMFITAVIGGGEVSLGGLAFPIGFLFVIVGRSELFTENFLIPVVSVFKGERSVGSLLELWALSWVGNLLGCGVSALLFNVPHAVGEPILRGYHDYAAYKLELPVVGLFVSAILAGAVMTVLTWLLLAVEHPVSRMLCIFAAGYLLFAANLSHSIVGSAEILVGYAGAGHSLAEAFGWIVVATVGNMVGGIGLVTLFRLVQAREGERQRSEGWRWD
jgi:formate/nitrite transporter FocA (FNT family)